MLLGVPAVKVHNVVTSCVPSHTLNVPVALSKPPAGTTPVVLLFTTDTGIVNIPVRSSDVSPPPL